MIDIKKYKEIEVFEPDNTITLFEEKDFHEFEEKPANSGYLFVIKEYHPEDEEKVIANECYVFDTTSRCWFAYTDILISQKEYDELHEEDTEDEVSTPAQQGISDPAKVKFLKEYIQDHKVDSSFIEIVDLVRYARAKGTKCPFTDNDRWSISRLIESEPELDDLIQKNKEEEEKATLGKVEEIAVEIAKLQQYREAPTVSMKKMLIKKYLLENGHGKLAYPAIITNIKDLADIK